MLKKLIILLSFFLLGWRFALIGDPQIAFTARDEQYGLIIKLINQEKDIDFVIILGDMTQDRMPEEIEKFNYMTSKLEPKVYYVFGNHDRYKTGGHYFMTHYHPCVYHSFKHKGDLFIALNTSGQFRLSDIQSRWLNALFNERDKYKRVFILTHVPLYDPEPIIRENGLLSAMNDPIFVENITDLIRDKKVNYVIAGHTHRNKSYIYKGVMHIQAGYDQEGSYTILEVEETDAFKP